MLTHFRPAIVLIVLRSHDLRAIAGEGGIVGQPALELCRNPRILGQHDAGGLLGGGAGDRR